MKVLVDASAWVPMEVASDQWRPNVLRVLSELRERREPIELHTTNWTLYEALSIMRRRDPRLARLLHERASKGALVVRIDPAIEKEAVSNFLNWIDKKASVVDHANTVAAVRSGCDAILSFDRDFIPLAAAAGLRVLR